MNQQEWDNSRDLQAMIRSVDPQRYDRKLRLYAVACCRRVWAQIQNPAARRLVDLSESFADGESLPTDLITIANSVSHYPRSDSAAHNAAALGCASWRASAECYLRAALDAEDIVVEPMTASDPLSRYHKSERRWSERSAQANLLRDIVGNPFRPVTFEPAWRTSTAVALATQMYESRDFAIMPILGDALQDAGCDSDDILLHCRDPQATHVRGCWVVDLVLGKS